MTQKDIRDIAAYWGAPFKAETILDMRYAKKQQRSGIVDGTLLNDLPAKHNSGFDGELIWRSFKLQLRQISSLTDNEVFTLAGYALGGEIDRIVCQVKRFSSTYYHPVYFQEYQLRTDGSHYFHDWWISENGIFGSGEGGDGDEVHTEGEGAVMSYLQSIGVYVPGTINPQYVELLP